jgi:hypothetical protein
MPSSLSHQQHAELAKHSYRACYSQLNIWLAELTRLLISCASRLSTPALGWHLTGWDAGRLSHLEVNSLFEMRAFESLGG